jgi:hypothetical protein
VKVEIKFLPNDGVGLDFEGRGLDVGSYDVVVNETVIGQLAMNQDGERTKGEADFETSPNDDEQVLPFNPSGMSVSIVKDGIIYFTGTIPSPVVTPIITG